MKEWCPVMAQAVRRWVLIAMTRGLSTYAWYKTVVIDPHSRSEHDGSRRRKVSVSDRNRTRLPVYRDTSQVSYAVHESELFKIWTIIPVLTRQINVCPLCISILTCFIITLTDSGYVLQSPADRLLIPMLQKKTSKQRSWYRCSCNFS